MIFVTIGTTAFEGLIKAADSLDKKFDVVIQKADGKYEPKHHKFFEYTDKFSNYLDKADVVVTHGGAGTLFDLIGRGKKIVGVANDERSDHHQADLLEELSRNGYLVWCQELKNLKDCLERAQMFQPKKYQKPECQIAEDIIKNFAS